MIIRYAGLEQELELFRHAVQEIQRRAAGVHQHRDDGDAIDSKYLYFVPGPSGSDNDHLLWKVEVSQISQVPEADSFVLLAAGLGFRGVMQWRRQR